MLLYVGCWKGLEFRGFGAGLGERGREGERGDDENP
jgi:hypothetical protein